MKYKVGDKILIKSDSAKRMQNISSNTGRERFENELCVIYEKAATDSAWFVRLLKDGDSSWFKEDCFYNQREQMLELEKVL